MDLDDNEEISKFWNLRNDKGARETVSKSTTIRVRGELTIIGIDWESPDSEHWMEIVGSSLLPNFFGSNEIETGKLPIGRRTKEDGSIIKAWLEVLRNTSSFSEKDLLKKEVVFVIEERGNSQNEEFLIGNSRGLGKQCAVIGITIEDKLSKIREIW